MPAKRTKHKRVRYRRKTKSYTLTADSEWAKKSKQIDKLLSKNRNVGLTNSEKMLVDRLIDARADKYLKS